MGDHDLLDYCTFRLQVVNDVQFVTVDTCGKDHDQQNLSTRSSADADNRLDAFISGQSSPCHK